MNNGTVAAESFPWNRTDIHVVPSSIFHADRIPPPILLLQGDVDIDVPIAESEQLFASLRLPGRKVEFIRFRGENHGIRGTDESPHAVHEITLA